MSTLRPPPTRANQPIGFPMSRCPYAAYKPCEVLELEVTADFKVPVSGKKEVSPHHITATMTSPSRYSSGIPPGLSVAVEERLRRYDTVLEVFADFPQPRTVNPLDKSTSQALKELRTGDGSMEVLEPVKLTAMATFAGGQCVAHRHAVVYLQPRGSGPYGDGYKENRRVNFTKLMLEPPPLAAMRFPLLDDVWSDQTEAAEDEDAPASGVLYVLGLVGTVLQALRPLEYEVVAESCGFRESGELVPPDLRALVRIFRKDTWKISVQIPAFGSFSREKVTELGFSGDTKTTSEKSKKIGQESSKTSNEVVRHASGARSIVTETVERSGDRSWSVETKTKNSAPSLGKRRSGRNPRPTSSTVRRKNIAKPLHELAGFDLVISRNDVDLPVLERISKLKESIDAYREALKKIGETLRAAPQLGWKYTLDISAFVGRIEAEFAPAVEPVIADGRYFPVTYKASVSIALKILELEFTVSFGVAVRALDSGLVIKIEGSIAVEIELKADWKLNAQDSARKELEVVAECKPKLLATAYVNLLGYTIAGAELSVSASCKLDEGKFIIDMERPSCDLTGTLEWLETNVSGWIKSPLWFNKRVKDIKIFEKMTLYEFGRANDHPVCAARAEAGSPSTSTK